MRGNPSKRSRSNNYRAHSSRTPALSFTSSQSRGAGQKTAHRPYFQTVQRADNTKTVQCAAGPAPAAPAPTQTPVPGGGGACQNVQMNGCPQGGGGAAAPAVVPEAEQVKRLREELNRRVAEIQQLDEQVFLLKAQLSLKDAEDKFARRNSQQVQNVKDELAFKAQELERTQEDLRKLRAETEKLRQAAEKRAVKKPRTAPATNSRLVSSSSFSQPIATSSQEDSAVYDRRFLSLESVSEISSVLSTDMLKLLQESPTETRRLLYNTLISDRSTLMPWAQVKIFLHKVVDELVKLLDTSTAAARTLRRLLLTTSRFKLAIDDPRAQKIFAVASNKQLSQPVRSAALEVLLIMAQVPCKRCSTGMLILKSLQQEAFEHNAATLELFCSLLGTQLKSSENCTEIGDWDFPNCAHLFKCCGEHTRGVVSVCSTLVAVLGDRAIRELCQQAVIRELVSVLNRVSLQSNEANRNDHALMKSASLLLSVLIKHDLEFEVDRTWKRLELISVIHLVSNTYPDIQEALHRYIDGLMTL